MVLKNVGIYRIHCICFRPFVTLYLLNIFELNSDVYKSSENTVDLTLSTIVAEFGNNLSVAEFGDSRPLRRQSTFLPTVAVFGDSRRIWRL